MIVKYIGSTRIPLRRHNEGTLWPSEKCLQRWHGWVRSFPHSSPTETHTKINGRRPSALSWPLWYDKVTTSSKSPAEKTSHSKSICRDGNPQQSSQRVQGDGDWPSGLSGAGHGKRSTASPRGQSPRAALPSPPAWTLSAMGKLTWFVFCAGYSSGRVCLRNCSHGTCLWIGPCLL